MTVTPESGIPEHTMDTNERLAQPKHLKGRGKLLDYYWLVHY